VEPATRPTSRHGNSRTVRARPIGFRGTGTSSGCPGTATAATARLRAVLPGPSRARPGGRDDRRDDPTRRNTPVVAAGARQLRSPLMTRPDVA
jgi:hypothetical protein